MVRVEAEWYAWVKLPREGGPLAPERRQVPPGHKGPARARIDNTSRSFTAVLREYMRDSVGPEDQTART
jgi:hypothetical protein